MPFTRGGYLLPIRFWIFFVGVFAAVDAFSFLWHPHLLKSSAYSWAFQVADPFWWGMAFLCASILCLGSLFRVVAKRKIGLYASVAGLGIYSLAASYIGLSIAVLTFDGQASAMSGALKWWAFLFLTARFLWHPEELHELPGRP